ncbi:EAL domain-containing protein [Sphaerotilus montanus]|uniref:Diguanylate cyclase (GGDEF)-like protein/PAS domain S-box-containing protein n=1 Tax=Sphaerotilus montanus TaxID=522889 RepID=A0A7Y9QZD8_9BURK|nr:EAL domain-containing protein [Sphaerotilus montanus]NYG32375.1 diguanylate cyclase (GGDEF)-like protein/PAS domain S-box-containing protein [Sphaerotilus montanus]NZD58783.1 EAL domain-containing protein [Sphaerotilus montanus]
MHSNRPKATSDTSTIVRLYGALLVIAITVGALVTAVALRDKEIQDWRHHLGSMSYMLTEHTAQTVFSAFLVLDAITEQVRQMDVQDEAAFRQRLSTVEMHQLLRDKIQGLSQLDVASIVAANGDNINFSRAHPVPRINLAERDYFKAHRDQPHLGDHISTAVRNKGNGKWTFYVSRRLDDAQGRFLGLVLVGLSVDAFTGVYGRLIETLGDGASISLYRGDLTMLARAPHQDDLIGRVNHSGTAHRIINEQGQQDAVVLADTPRFSSGLSGLRLTAVRKATRYPLVVSLVVPDTIFLASWKRSVTLIASMSLLSIAFVLAGIGALSRTSRRRAQTEHELRESEAKFHTMVDGATDWEYWLRPDGSVHYMTPSVEQFTGYRAEAFERQPDLIATLVHPDDRTLWRQQVQAVGAPEATPSTARPLDLRIVHRNGSQRWVSHVSRPVHGPDGRHLGQRISMRDITERKASETEIRQLAYYDALTGLPNRRMFLDRLGHTLAATERNQTHSALVLLDLDHFKKLNDTQGHDVGDRLLVEVARRLALAVRDADTVARLGGDEFALMLDGLDPDEPTAARQAEQIAEKIHAILNQPYALNEANDDHRSSPSIGMTLLYGRSTPLDVLMKQADVALYQAKDAGRNAIRFFNPAMQAAIDARIAMENALRQALVLGQFQLHYQPQVDATGWHTGAEALIRWSDPVRGMVPPDRFIPLAEETGLIIEIGQWVLDTACAQLAQWATDPARQNLQISVNVSARQFHQSDFVERVRRSLAASGANPARLMLELTESIVIDRVDEVIDRMEQLNVVGVKFSLDDFGTGYSSLSCLKRLPLDEVKIDRSFVRDLVDDSNDAAIVQAILAMSHSLGLRVVAEGVETLAQRDFLLTRGCETFQGYLFGKPAPIAQWAGSGHSRGVARVSPLEA